MALSTSGTYWPFYIETTGEIRGLTLHAQLGGIGFRRIVAITVENLRITSNDTGLVALLPIMRAKLLSIQPHKSK